VGDLEFLFLALLAAAVLVRGADLVGVPYPIVLVLFGVAIGFVDGLPDIHVDPHVIFLVFLPPLLSVAGYWSSPRELREDARALTWLSLVLVLATMCAVAVVAHAVVPGIGWAESFVLGAVLAPTDPVAATATFARLGVPDRVALLVEGEAMTNDATALVAFGAALTAVTTGVFAFGHALGDVVLSAVGGLAIGLVAGWLEVTVIRLNRDRTLGILLTLLVPYAAYIVAERAGVSGVLAAVACGLYLGWHSHDALDADGRLSGVAFWDVVTLGLNALVFLLLGLQLPGIWDESSQNAGALIGAAAVISLVVIVVRMAAQMVPWAIPDASWRERVAIGWSGMRGAISMAAALSIPTSVGARADIVFVTVVVIGVTLIGQGLTLPPLLKLLALKGSREWSPEEAIARLEAAQAALDRLDELEDDEQATEEQLKRMRDLYRARFRACQAVIAGEEERAAVRPKAKRFREIRRELIGVERMTLIDLRNDGRLRPDTLRQIERDLDLEEARLGAA
jgi:monovalent cation/hydrogen antiporter